MTNAELIAEPQQLTPNHGEHIELWGVINS